MSSIVLIIVGAIFVALVIVTIVLANKDAKRLGIDRK